MDDEGRKEKTSSAASQLQVCDFTTKSKWATQKVKENFLNWDQSMSMQSTVANRQLQMANFRQISPKWSLADKFIPSDTFGRNKLSRRWKRTIVAPVERRQLKWRDW